MKLWSNSNVQRSLGGFNPERRLLAAILQRAITDFLTGEGELQFSAKEWLYGADDPNEAFGFSYICEALDFHQEELRKAIAGQHARLCRERKEASDLIVAETNLVATAA
jgi:hypothetical protein